MADYTLHDGREITVDPYAVTHEEYNKLITPGPTGQDDELIIARAAGLTADEIKSIPERDWRALIKVVFNRITQPDPL